MVLVYSATDRMNTVKPACLQWGLACLIEQTFSGCVCVYKILTVPVLILIKWNSILEAISTVLEQVFYSLAESDWLEATSRLFLLARSSAFILDFAGGGDGVACRLVLIDLIGHVSAHRLDLNVPWVGIVCFICKPFLFCRGRKVRGYRAEGTREEQS